MTPDATIIFTPSGRRGSVPVGTTVLDAARRLGVDLDSVCGGRALCGRCMVTPAFGEFTKHAIVSEPGHVGELTSAERTYHGRRALGPTSRLGCSARILDDLVVDVPAASQVHRPVVRKTVALDDLVIDPVVRLYLVDVPAPDLGGTGSDRQRLLDALAQQWDLTGLDLRPAILAELQPALARGARTVTVAVHGGRWVNAVWPGFVDTAYGVGIDIGSTTVAGHLCDLATGEVVASAGIMNPQIRFGEDLMSRVSYVMMHEQGAHELTLSIRAGLRELVAELVASADIERDRVVDVVLVGNPIMHHIALGIDPTPLGTAPFTLATEEPIDAWADDIELELPHAHLHVLPCIAGHVGADTAAAVLQEGPHRGDAVMLLVDVGTNAEIVLGNRHQLFAASSPTGPAFEGAQLSCGQRATTGAIERVRVDRDTLEPRFKVIGADAWSDEARFRGTGRDHRHHRRLRLGNRRGHRRAVPRRRDSPRRHDRRRRRRALAARRARRTHVRVRAPRRSGGGAAHHAERRARDPTRQSRAPRGRSPAHGPRRDQRVRLGQARGRVREPYRSVVRAGARPDSRLRSLDRAQRRQRGRERRRARSCRTRRAARSRASPARS